MDSLGPDTGIEVDYSLEKENVMKPLKIMFTVLVPLLLFSGIASAGGEFAWMRDFNIRAEADPSGLRARLEARFKVGAVNIETALGNVDNPAEAYMQF